MKGRASRLAGRDEVFQSAFPAQNKQTKKNKTIKMVCLFFFCSDNDAFAYHLHPIENTQTQRWLSPPLAISAGVNDRRLQHPTRFHIPGFTGFLLAFTGLYRVLLGFTGFYLVLLALTRFFLFHWLLPGRTGFYKVASGWLPGFYLVLPGFTGLRLRVLRNGRKQVRRRWNERGRCAVAAMGGRHGNEGRRSFA